MQMIAVSHPRRQPIADPLPFEYDDGGRSSAGYKGSTGDCVVRAIAIATQLPYQHVYDDLNELAKLERPRKRRNGKEGKRSGSRTGVHRATYDKYMRSLGWQWIPTMHVGSGCTTHLAQGEIPSDRRLVVRLSRHLVAVVDGIVHDISDPCRGGTRCVYGYWQRPTVEK